MQNSDSNCIILIYNDQVVVWTPHLKLDFTYIIAEREKEEMCGEV